MWLFSSESSPIYQFTLYNPDIGNAITLLNMPAILLGFLVSGNVHAPSPVATALGVLAQWFVIGCLASWAWFKLRRGNPNREVSDA
ncbi:hypothetical protein DSM104443_00258 [Usitatibacter rugosus]|uniref:Uncharacterized protein n=1 Tax=Usitatibacter rugosus TaxID=2732067 RepID=A0A6M4GPT1_9PROT|nr:hypothetical protein DSM104443_00258 [Usitatibacter rugosus]